MGARSRERSLARLGASQSEWSQVARPCQLESNTFNSHRHAHFFDLGLPDADRARPDASVCKTATGRLFAISCGNVLYTQLQRQRSLSMTASTVAASGSQRCLSTSVHLRCDPNPYEEENSVWLERCAAVYGLLGLRLGYRRCQ